MSDGPLIKICGLTSAEAVDAALAAGADMVGFVFFPPSPRNLDFDRARKLAQRVQGRAAKVALTVNADDAALADIVAAIEPDWLQLHGDEDPARTLAVRRRFGRPVIKAIGVSVRSDLGRVAHYDHVADSILLDAKAAASASRPGGNGAAFDWTLLDVLQRERPWLLSGGLTCDNVREALLQTGAPGLDVSSGVERGPGDKDPDLIRRFISTVRSARA